MGWLLLFIVSVVGWLFWLVWLNDRHNRRREAWLAEQDHDLGGGGHRSDYEDYSGDGGGHDSYQDNSSPERNE